MKATDFTYDGSNLSDHGYMICRFDGGDSMSGVETDSQRTFNSLSLFYGKFQPFTYSTYDNALQMTFSICKKVCPTADDMIISLSEMRGLKHWLNRPDAHKLTIDDDEFDGIYWEGSFNIQEIHNNGDIIGANLTFESNRPFAVGETVTISGEIVDPDNERITITDRSDDTGYIYPTVRITCGDDGDLRITNASDSRTTLVKNCVTGEEITFTDNLQISSSIASHKVANDFNYKFIRINNQYMIPWNVLRVNMPCEYTIQYNPIVKAVAS